MKVKEDVLIEALKDVICDLCESSTLKYGSPQFGALESHWGYGSDCNGDQYELHLCEKCFFKTLLYLKKLKFGSKAKKTSRQIGVENYGLKPR